MRIPSSLVSLVDEGVIAEVVRPLMSGKEAEVFLVLAGGELRVAKVYKEAQSRTFKHRAEYTEGRKVRNSRDQRAMDKRSRYGRSQDEAAWRSTEVDMIYRLRDAGVRVPKPHIFIDGVLVMEMVADAEGDPAPRLAEVSFTREQATWVFERLLAEAVRMLCAGVVHGDLSDFNVLMSADGPVIIDFPQSVDASKNQNARKLLLRDVANLERFLSRFVPPMGPRAYGEEMWDLYSRSLLTPETRLTGRHRGPSSPRRADTAAVLDLIDDANRDERRRREREGLGMRGAPPAQEHARAGDPRDRGRPGERPGPHAGNGAGQRTGQQGQWPAQQGQRPQNHAPRHAPPDHRPQNHAPRQAPPEHRPQPNHEPRQAQPEHRPQNPAPRQAQPEHRPQHEHRPQNHAPRQAQPDHRPQHEHRPQNHAPRQAQPQHRPQNHAPRQAQAGNGSGQRPEQVETPPAPPRRRVVISVSTSDRRPGTRRGP